MQYRVSASVIWFIFFNYGLAIIPAVVIPVIWVNQPRVMDSVPGSDLMSDRKIRDHGSE